MTKISNQYSLTNVLTADVVNGRVGVNNTSPTVALDVTGAARVSGISTFTTTSASTSVFNSTEANGGYITFQRSGTNYGFIGSAYHLLTPVGANTDLAVSTTGAFIVGTGASLIPRMTITAAGNVGIGTTSPTANFRLQVVSSFDGVSVISSDSSQTLRISSSTNHNTLFRINNFNNNFYDIQNQPSDNSLVFDYNDNERMRITSGGQILFGVTSAASAFNMQVGTNGGVLAVTSIRLQNSYLDGTTGYFGAEITASDNGVDGHNIQFKTRAGATASFGTRMTITTNGSIGAPTGTNIYNPSDIRLKQNISTLNNGLDKVMALNPVKFNWIDNYETSENGKNMLGFIAQEVLTAVPEAVESFAQNTIVVEGAEITDVMRVNEKFIIPVLVAAIQEQQTQINELKALINA
jgi:hypothetical protein